MSDIDIRSGLSEEEKKRLEKIDKLDSNKKRKKVIMAAVTFILIMFFVLGTVFGGMHILSFEGTEALPAEEISYPAVLTYEKEIISSFNSLIKDTMNFNGIKLDTGFSVSLVDNKIDVQGENAEAVKPVIEHISGSFVSLVSSAYENHRYKGVYGEDFSDYLFPYDFTSDDAIISAFTEEENENSLKYLFAFDEKELSSSGSDILNTVFNLNEADTVVEGILDKMSEMFSPGEISTEYDEITLTANIDRLKNELNSMEQKRLCHVVVPAEFTGDYEEFGKLTFSFTLELKKSYNFIRAGFIFRDDVFYIEKGSSDEFKTKVISDESPADIVIEFISSDPSVLSVDKGFFKGEKVSPDPVTVTGRYTYNGITYEDTCVFYVRVPVEGVKLEEKEISIKTGEEKKLNEVLSPDDATLRKVYWFSTDENTVTVDENGVIKGVSPGNTTVYLVTLDGNYKASCNVTVTQ